MPYKQYRALLKQPTLHKTSAKLVAYNDEPIKVKGRCIVNLEHKSHVYPTLFIVADTQSIPIIGFQSCSRLKLVKRVHEIKNHPSPVKEYSVCFGEIGTVKKTYRIYLDPSVPPVIDACRKVPIAVHDRLKQELHRMENLKIITPVSEPTEWVSSVVTTEKPNGKLRVCLDPNNLNKAMRRHHHKIPTPEEIFSRMSGAKHFTKLDASTNAYWQVPLDDESSEYHESNGYAERTIQTVKKTLQKCLKQKEDPRLALLALKTSKSSTTGTAKPLASSSRPFKLS